jgi:hypothetical protein
MVAAGCQVPLQHASLAPVPVAGQGDRPLKAQIRKVAMSHDLMRGGANLDTDSRLAVELDLYNADRQRTVTVQAPPRLVVRDALGGPAFDGRPVYSGVGGLPAVIPMGEPPTPSKQIVLRPGEGLTVWFAYAGFPADGPAHPVTATVVVQADGDAALELAIANPVPGGPRWKSDKTMVSIGVGGTLSTFQTGTNSGASSFAPLSFEAVLNRGRFFWGLGLRYELIYREAIAGGPLGFGTTTFVTAGMLPWRFPFGFYGQAGFMLGGEAAPEAYRQVGGPTHSFHLPVVAGGIVWNAGARLGSSGPFPIERPLSALRRFQLRAGYAQWFNFGSGAGAGGFTVSFVGLLGP